MPPGKAHDWICGGTQHHKAKGQSGYCSPTVSLRVPVLRSTHVLGESIRVWGAAFGPAPKMFSPAYRDVGGRRPRYHRGAQSAAQGKTGQSRAGRGSGLLPGSRTPSRALQ